MRTLALTIALLAACGAARATTYYVSDCGAGAAATCVAGNDNNKGTSPDSSWRSCAQVTSRFPLLSAGDRVLFARGSAQPACRLYFLSNSNSRRNNPITLGAYQPTWAAPGAPAPILHGTNGANTLSLMNSGDPSHDEGYVVEDLHFVGPGPSATMPAIGIGNDVDWVTLQRLEIEQSAGGVQCNGGTLKPPRTGSDGLSEHLVIRQSNIHHNRGNGLLLACNDTLVENNTLDNNGVGLLDHHIYIMDAEMVDHAITTTQVVIRGNTLTNNTPYASRAAPAPTPGACASVAIVVHGLKKGVVIENNRVIEPVVPASGSCWGIAADPGNYSGIYAREGLANVVIRGNTIVNYALGAGVDICDTCTLESNAIYSDVTGANGIAVPSKWFQASIPGNTTNQRISVRSNTVYLNRPTQNSQAIRLSREGAGHVVTNNLVYFGPGSTANSACFNTSELPADAFHVFDHNLCWFAGMPGQWDTQRSTLALQRAAGLDLRSLQADPRLNTPLAPRWVPGTNAGSPAIGAGHRSAGARLALGGVLRDTAPDIGAFEFGASYVVPGTPTGIGVQ